MSRHGRKALIRKLEKVAAALVLADLAVYFVLVLGLRNRIRVEQDQRDTLYRQARDKQMRLLRLEQYEVGLPDAKEQIAAFEKERVPRRQQGYSRAARLVRRAAEQAGVRVSNVTYHSNSQEQEPLDRLTLRLGAEGSFAGLVKFAHGLETSSDFLVVREFNFQPGEGDDLALRVDADLYLLR